MIAFSSTTFRPAPSVQTVSKSLLGVGCTFLLLRIFLLENLLWVGLWRLQLHFSGIPCKITAETTGILCTYKLKEGRNVYTSVGKQQTPSHSLLSEISKDSVLAPKPCWGFSHLSCRKSFFCCCSASCTEDQLVVTTAVFGDCNGQSQSSAVVVCMHSAPPVRQGGWIRYGNMDVEVEIPTSGMESHTGYSGAACVCRCARLSPGEMLSLLFQFYHVLQPELCASWIQLLLHTGQKRRIWGMYVCVYTYIHAYMCMSSYSQVWSTITTSRTKCVWGCIVSFFSNLSALCHPVICYTAFQFAACFSHISSPCEQTSNSLNRK